MSRAAELLGKCASPAELDGRPALTVAGALSMLAALDTLAADEARCPVLPEAYGRLSASRRGRGRVRGRVGCRVRDHALQ